MISGIVLIFAVPMIIAALLISPTAFHNLIHGLPVYAVLGVALPIVGWRTFVIEFAFPRAADTRLAAVIRVWVVGTVMVAAVFNLLMAVLDYSPARPGPNPTAGFLLAGFVFSMFVSSGVWGALLPILPREVAIRGALVTGCVLFGIAATFGYFGLSVKARNGSISTATGSQQPLGEP
jgi:hypothetical protein